ncbi:MAG TPA: ABC transporter permease [Elusimicrobia bacterium]|nr:ABC transporter permease [Elusimicrobiota bacterium]
MADKHFRFFLIQIGAVLLSILAAFAVGAALMLLIKVNPLEVYWKLFEGVLLNPYGIAQTIFKATPLIMTGLAIALGFKAGIFNIGAEGQMIVGGFFCAYAGFSLHGLPPALHIVICAAAAFAGGLAWAAIPAVLRVKTGAHEVITTIMMNFIALALTNYFITYYFHLPETVHTQLIAPAAGLARMDSFVHAFRGSPANMAFFIALALSACVWWALWKTPYGYETRAVGLSPFAAETAGINIKKNLLFTFLLSGGLSGLAAMNFIMGYKHYFEEGFSQGSGFMGIAVALVGQNHPIGIILAAFLFGALSHGTLVINALVPKDIIQILQALVIIFVISSNLAVRKFYSAVDSTPKAGQAKVKDQDGK